MIDFDTRHLMAKAKVNLSLVAGIAAMVLALSFGAPSQLFAQSDAGAPKSGDERALTDPPAKQEDGKAGQKKRRRGAIKPDKRSEEREKAAAEAKRAKENAARAWQEVDRAQRAAEAPRASAEREPNAELKLRARELDLSAAQARIQAMQADQLASAAEQAAKALESTNAGLSSLFHHFSVMTGAKFLNPYSITISSNVATLTKSGDSTVPFLEFAAFNRFVLNTSPNFEDRDPGKFRHSPTIGLIDRETDADPSIWLCPWAHVPDIEVHVGFTFKSGASSSNFSANTLAGGSDFYANGAVGFPILRYTSTNDDTAMQVTLEAAGGAATDKNFLAVHPNVFVGLGYQWRFKSLIDTNYGVFCGRAGYGWLDVPRFASNAETNVVMVGGLPKFDLRGSPSLGTYIAYPLGKVFLNVGANVYFRDNPAPWEITVGTTVPIDNLLSLFGLSK